MKIVRANQCDLWTENLQLEKRFLVCDGDPDFAVIDAECEEICRCRTLEKAELVAYALNTLEVPWTE